MLTIDRWAIFYTLLRLLLASEVRQNDTFQPTDINSTIGKPLKQDFSDSSRTACFKHLGCFSTGPPFFNLIYRPISFLPQVNLRVKLLLYTPSNPNHAYNLTFNENLRIQVANSPLRRNLPTKIIIPGFEVNLKPDNPFFNMKDEILKEGSYNVIIDDWSLSNGFPYAQAVANTRKVGAELAYILTIFKEIKGMNFKRVHIIGHSLGAHVGGYVGKRIKKLGRITGLDPAGPYFQHADKIVRLDKTDAHFVDIIHSNGAASIFGGFGLFQTIGHEDFYPNGGQHQPSCKGILPFINIKANVKQEVEEQKNYPLVQELLESEKNKSKIVGNSKFAAIIPDIFKYICEHSISRTYFIESIKNRRFLGVQCQDYDMFQKESCTNKNAIVAKMGYHAKKIEGVNGLPRFYLDTSKNPPHCIKSWILKLFEFIFGK